MARNLLIITIVGGINIHSPAILGYHPGTTEFHRKKKNGRDTAVVDHHSGKPGARHLILGDPWEAAKNGGRMAVDTLW